MYANNYKTISNFFLVGINYRKTDADVRGKYAIGNEQYTSILSKASQQYLNELFILSTCNRTEVYGFAEHAGQFIDLICNETTGTSEEFRSICYIRKGEEAVEHLFLVGAGLDSQILGDYEIVGQLKSAVRVAKEKGFSGSFTERLVNCVLRSSKTIKNQTNLSGGTVSVSFAAVQYIKENIREIETKKILLLGIGKIGRNTAKNLTAYLGTKNITLINRSQSKAIELATELGLRHAEVSQLKNEVNAADIILVATNAALPLIKAIDISSRHEKLFIDLSIPFNVEREVGHIEGIKLVNVDELSKLKDQTLRQREAEVPKAKQIITAHLDEFMEWYEMRRHVPLLKAVKSKLLEIHSDPLFLPLYKYHQASTDQKIQRVINGMAHKMKTENQRGCYYIEAINEFIATGS